ncbi:Ppx/GppA family phosphatase [Streptomyces sp. ADMS]|uniref:Ppx/GppA phosphatase family protein n=1 Tax=Streptomyces sp. ADMS TaxID=3071415 RepID=UPI00296E4CFE|nr:Ppx/GppA family phosphatase [Streptomyces sp. ADMS]MDW4910036.1 Ppx/GppA family phosphatase [Streptomyces sp. ADMS]
MRMSVLDVGSNTVRLMVADTENGVPLPAHTAKWRLRLSEQVEPGGKIPERAVRQLVQAVDSAAGTARRWGAGEPLAFATAVVRSAPNRLDVLRAVRVETGVPLCTLPGEVEAALTFLGARRWMGWRAGSLVLFDIGGGSLEVAFGRGRLPDFAASLPLGAGRLTREFFPGQDPPSEEDLKALRRRVRHELRDVAARLSWEGPHMAVATSRTFQQLARLCGAAPGRQGLFVARQLDRADLGACLRRLAALPAAERATLPGVSAPRAPQSLAGAVVGHTAMKLMGIKTLTICPWAIREGVLLRCVEDGGSWWTEITREAEMTQKRAEAAPPGPTPLRIATPEG